MPDEIERGTAGSSLESFLKDEGMFERVNEAAIKSVVAWQLVQLMEAEHITRTELARRLDTSRAQLNRLLDPDNDGVTVAMLGKAARAVGRTLRLELA